MEEKFSEFIKFREYEKSLKYDVVNFSKHNVST